MLGIEALLRWNHPVKGNIPPSDFIALAEETGLIIPIGRWVMREACARTAEWNAKRGDGRSFSVTVNLSVRQLESPSLVSDVREALDDSGLAPTLLVLEITENALMHRTETTLERLHDLKAQGVRLAIDDFGTGYSSLSYLQQFPVDILKIDRAFTDGLMRGTHDDALARTIIALGDLLTLRTIAEGVEHARQHSRLRDLGCDYGQGYLFSRPLAHGGHRPAADERLPRASRRGADRAACDSRAAPDAPDRRCCRAPRRVAAAPSLPRLTAGRERSALESLATGGAIRPLGVSDPVRRGSASDSGKSQRYPADSPVVAGGGGGGGVGRGARWVAGAEGERWGAGSGGGEGEGEEEERSEEAATSQ